MEAWFESLLASLLAALALPQYGLSTVFVVALVSATLLPLGSEPAVFGLVKLDPTLFWPAILVATAGNTAGGAITWWMGYGAEVAYERVTHHKPHENRALQLLHRFGAKACLLSWLPIVGDPLCAVAGWLRLPFWPCVAYMAVGKFARYLTMTAVLLWVFPGRYDPPPERMDPPPQRLAPLPPQGRATSAPAQPDPRLPHGMPAHRAASLR